MKHFLKIIIISFIFSTTSLAQEAVYYCIDDETIGFEYTNKQNQQPYTSKKFKADRFKLQINFEDQTVKMGNFVLYYRGAAFYSDNIGHSISMPATHAIIDRESFSYARSGIFGDITIYLSVGICEKF